jgi:hypothetical protein
MPLANAKFITESPESLLMALMFQQQKMISHVIKKLNTLQQ